MGRYYNGNYYEECDSVPDEEMERIAKIPIGSQPPYPGCSCRDGSGSGGQRIMHQCPQCHDIHEVSLYAPDDRLICFCGRHFACDEVWVEQRDAGGIWNATGERIRPAAELL